MLSSLRGINEPNVDSINTFPMASGLFLVCSGKRTATENLRSPSNMRVADFPPIAVSMTCWMSDTLIPKRAIFRRSMSMVRYDCPACCSTLISRTPSTVAMIAAISPAFSVNVSKSSPNSLIATSDLVPEISSSTRS